MDSLNVPTVWNREIVFVTKVVTMLLNGTTDWPGGINDPFDPLAYTVIAEIILSFTTANHSRPVPLGLAWMNNAEDVGTSAAFPVYFIVTLFESNCRNIWVWVVLNSTNVILPSNTSEVGFSIHFPPKHILPLLLISLDWPVTEIVFVTLVELLVNPIIYVSFTKWITNVWGVLIVIVPKLEKFSFQFWILKWKYPSVEIQNPHPLSKVGKSLLYALPSKPWYLPKIFAVNLICIVQ